MKIRNTVIIMFLSTKIVCIYIYIQKYFYLS